MVQGSESKGFVAFVPRHLDSSVHRMAALLARDIPGGRQRGLGERGGGRMARPNLRMPA